MLVRGLTVHDNHQDLPSTIKRHTISQFNTVELRLQQSHDDWKFPILHVRMTCQRRRNRRPPRTHVPVQTHAKSELSMHRRASSEHPRIWLCVLLLRQNFGRDTKGCTQLFTGSSFKLSASDRETFGVPNVAEADPRISDQRLLCLLVGPSSSRRLSQVLIDNLDKLNASKSQTHSRSHFDRLASTYTFISVRTKIPPQHP